jgi:hypothetical protein
MKITHVVVSVIVPNNKTAMATMNAFIQQTGAIIEKVEEYSAHEKIAEYSDAREYFSEEGSATREYISEDPGFSVLPVTR